MKSLKKYIAESKKTYPFLVKIAGDLAEDTENTLKTLLEKYQVVSFKKASTTPVQTLPLDFPRLSNVSVNIFDVTLDYPVTPHELVNYLGNGLRINEQRIVVRNPEEPYEQYQKSQEKREGALLNDPNYSESPNAKFEDYYGDKYNTSFVKALNDDLKAKRKERGEVIPSSEDGKTLNDNSQNNTSPVGSKKGK